MDNSFPTVSYAECVKTNSNGSKHVDSYTAPMSWYEQVESYQNSIVVSYAPFFDRLIFDMNGFTFDHWKIWIDICSIAC